jgi:hypothetical protein
MEYFARKAKLRASCHQLRHTMAIQMLNADAPLVCEHPGPPGSQLDHDDAALLQGLQCEGAAGLPPGYGAHRQPLPGAKNVLTEETEETKTTNN